MRKTSMDAWQKQDAWQWSLNRYINNLQYHHFQVLYRCPSLQASRVHIEMILLTQLMRNIKHHSYWTGRVSQIPNSRIILKRGRKIPFLLPGWLAMLLLLRISHRPARRNVSFFSILSEHFIYNSFSHYCAVPFEILRYSLAQIYLHSLQGPFYKSSLCPMISPQRTWIWWSSIYLYLASFPQ